MVASGARAFLLALIKFKCGIDLKYSKETHTLSFHTTEQQKIWTRRVTDQDLRAIQSLEKACWIQSDSIEEAR